MPPRPADAAPPPGFSRADLHLHTTFSDGRATPEDLLNYYALHSDVRVLAITDHDTLDGALHARRYAEAHPDLFSHLEVVVGEEVTAREGHVLGLFLADWVPPGMSAEGTIEAIHAQGGVAIAAHPYTSWMRWAGLVGVGDLCRSLPFDAVETRNSNFTEVLANRRAGRNATGRACVGSSDAHFLDAVGRCHTDFPGSSAEDLRRAIRAGTTRPGGGCYGVPTLVRYVLDRLRAGGPILPRREGHREAAAGGGLEMVVHAETGSGAAGLLLAGALDASSMRPVREAIRKLLQARVGVALDLSRVRFLDSTGITALVTGLKVSRELGVGFQVVAPSEACLNTLRLARLVAVLPIAPDLATAWRRLAVQRRPFEREAEGA